MAPNSWRYLVVFIGECRGASIVRTYTLVSFCFQLCKGQCDYYLATRGDFNVGGAPLNNK
ncbi:hypothetical protein GW17_00053820, partial [Ensete ventricosum]